MYQYSLVFYSDLSLGRDIHCSMLTSAMAPSSFLISFLLNRTCIEVPEASESPRS